MHRLVLLAFLLLLDGDDGAQEGRRGNAHYEQGAYAEAVAAYRAGLEALGAEAPGAVHYGLLNNLGAALHRQGTFDGAQEAFSQAVSLAPDEAAYTRAAYNAGNNAYALQQLEQALDFYKDALLADPENEDAKFNYEFVKRRLQEQQQQQQQQQQGQNEDDSPQNQDESSDENDEQEGEQPSPDAQQPPQDQQEPSDQGQSQDPGEDAPPEERPQQAPSQPDPTQLSQEQAQRILQALENEEEELLREVQKLNARPRRVEKDW